MAFNDDNNFSWVQRTHEKTLEFYREYKDEGFRLCSLSISGDNPANGKVDPRYSAVMIKGFERYDTESVFRRTQGEFQQKFEEMAAKGYGPYIVCAAGHGNHTVFGGSFRAMDTIPLIRLSLSPQEFVELNFEQRQQGNILIWADCFGKLGALRYCGIWAKNHWRTAWNSDGIAGDKNERQARFDAMREAWARPSLISATPDGRVMQIYVDNRIGDWSMRTEMTFDEFQDYRSTKKEEGLYPFRIASSGVGGNTRFSMICATQDVMIPRTFRVSGRSTAVKAATTTAIDDAMKSFITEQNLRGAALAIVNGSRLVLARGYTLAEPQYPDITPETMFRQASVSKLYCALAIWRMIGEIGQGDIDLNTKMLSILDLHQTGGAQPADWRMQEVTVAHLLESCSGIAQTTVRKALKEWRDTGFTPQPMTDGAVRQAIAARAMKAMPGTYTDYGQTDYYLLGQLAAERLGVPTFADALKQLVLDPLGMTHTKNARSLADDRRDGEARHHLAVQTTDDDTERRHLELAKSVVTTDRRQVPLQYGGLNMEVFSSAGGLSSSVVDMARIAAAICSVGRNSSLFHAQTLTDMLENAADAAARPHGTKGEHRGYHGFDGCNASGPLNNRAYAFAKGGLLNGVRASIQGNTDGFAYAFAVNGDYAKSINWRGMLDAIVGDDTDWGVRDLFPGYGMASL